MYRHLRTVRKFELRCGYIEDAEVGKLKIEVISLFGTLQNVGLYEFGFEVVEEQKVFMQECGGCGAVRDLGGVFGLMVPEQESLQASEYLGIGHSV